MAATDTELRKAVSCAYYAMFHTLCRAYADVMVGPHAGSRLEQELWNMAYRTFDHGPVRSKCNDAGSMSTVQSGHSKISQPRLWTCNDTATRLITIPVRPSLRY